LKRTLTGIAAVTLALGTFAAPMTAAAATKYNPTKVAHEYATTLKPITEGKTESFTVTIKDSHNKAISNALVSFSSSNTSVVTVSKSQVVTNKSGQATVVLTGKKPGTAYVTVKVNGNTHTYKVTVVAGTVAITGAPTDGIAVGQKVNLGLTDNGKTVTSGVTWTVTPDDGAVVQNGKFIASAPGTYTVTASYGGKKATAKVVVYGVASGLKVDAIKPLVANGQSTETITVYAVDANGNKVSNFNGTATVAYATAAKYGSQFYVNGTGTQNAQTLTFVNGKATFQVVATSNPDVTDTFNFSDLKASAGSSVATSVTYPSVTLSTVAPVATSLSLTPDLSGLNADGSSIADITVQVLDQAGQPMNSGSGFVTYSISGQGTFVDGTTASYTHYVTGTDHVKVKSSKGESGNIVVTVSSPTLGTKTVTIPTYVETAPGSIKATASKSSVGGDGVDYTVITVQLLDKNGHLMTDQTGDVVNIAFDSTSNSSLKAYALKTDGTPDITGGAKTSVSLTNGQAKFAVEATSGYTGAATITLTDGNNLTTTVPLTFVSGAAAGISETASASVVKTGDTVSFKVQLVDAKGNPVKKSGVKIDFAVDTNDNHGTLAATSALTDANGVATVSGTADSTAGKFTVTATVSGSSPAQTASATVVVTDAASIATAVVAESGNALKSGTFGAGTTWSNQKFDLQNAVGQVIASGGSATDKVTFTTSDPKVISFDSYDPGSTNTKTVTANAGVATAPTITAKQAGTATITVTDVSVASKPSVTYTITVQPGAPTGNAYIELNGQQISSSNPVVVAANTPVALTIVNVDAGGNPVPVTNQYGASFALNDPDGGQFRATPNGTNIGYVTIPVGQTSVTVYYVNSNAGSYSRMTVTKLDGVSQVFTTSSNVTAGNLVVDTGHEVGNPPLQKLSATKTGNTLKITSTSALSQQDFSGIQNGAAFVQYFKAPANTASFDLYMNGSYLWTAYDGQNTGAVWLDMSHQESDGSGWAKVATAFAKQNTDGSWSLAANPVRTYTLVFRNAAGNVLGGVTYTLDFSGIQIQ
jgi:hypothetical protein